MASDELIARLDRTIEENSRVIEANSRVIDDLRGFLREITIRQEHVLNGVVDAMRDLREESRAQRQALLRLIDSLPPPRDEPAT